MVNLQLDGIKRRLDSVARSRRDRFHSRRISNVLGADLRSLAALRIALGVVVLIDLIGRAQNLKTHYTDDGVLPRAVLLSGLNDWRWSLNLMNGSLPFQYLIFLIAGVAAVGMILGYRTRLMTVVVWVAIFSIQTRNPLVLSAADSLLRLLLFWSMFLPLGAWWSIDRLRIGKPRYRSMQVVSVGTAAILAQIAFMYWFTALLKTGADWRETGLALHYAFGARDLTRPAGEYLYQFDGLLRVLTFGSLGLEIAVPLLLFCPVRSGPVRTGVVAVLMLFHLGIFVSLDLGIFPVLNVLSMVGFLPTWFWDRAETRARQLVGFRIADWQRAQHAALGITALPPSYTAARPGLPPADEPSPPGHIPFHPLASLLATCCLIIVLGWNVTTVSNLSVPPSVSPVAQSLGLYQRWNMFAPTPPQATRWFVYAGSLMNGTNVNLLPTIVRDDLEVVQEVSWEEPADLSNDAYGDKYWRKYLVAVAASGHGSERLALARYICRTWNAHYGEGVALVQFRIVALHRDTRTDGEVAPIEQRIVSEHTCA